ncbi:proto-oncogene c-Rel-like [Salmo trutta]|uniref:proto-oncogene c-Rel-like n=1 Tax=Salmo trutta TaxID=8032 RepID=UPI001132853F|nr:proto-oncogene c-Rel-like [Salmo trutta]
MDVAEPSVQIFEQPKQRGMRFRYKCEGRSAGSIPGERSSENNRSYPTIQILNYCGKGKVRVSLVTKNEPFRPHPHDLVGKDCKEGFYEAEFGPERKVFAFQNLGIQCVRRREVKDSIMQRMTRGINPFNGESLSQLQSLWLFSLSPPLPSLSLLSYSPTPSFPHPSIPLIPCSCPDDIEVRFFTPGWEAKGSFSQADVHRQVAIVFKSPPYYDTSITGPVTVHMQLRRPTDQEVSEPMEFRYLPDDKDPYGCQEKKRRREHLMKTLPGFLPLGGMNPMNRPKAVPHSPMAQAMRKDINNIYMKQPSPAMMRQTPPTMYNHANQHYQQHSPQQRTMSDIHQPECGPNPNPTLSLETIRINPRAPSFGQPQPSPGWPDAPHHQHPPSAAPTTSSSTSTTSIYTSSSTRGKCHHFSQGMGSQDRRQIQGSQTQTLGLQAPWNSGGEAGFGFLLDSVESDEIIQGLVGGGGPQTTFQLKQEPLTGGQEGQMIASCSFSASDGQQQQSYANLLPRPMSNSNGIAMETARHESTNSNSNNIQALKNLQNPFTPANGMGQEGVHFDLWLPGPFPLHRSDSGTFSACEKCSGSLTLKSGEVLRFPQRKILGVSSQSLLEYFRDASLFP